ncbi:MAG: GNAT family N-acetyltransferase [Myxococcota bacterium]
MRIEAVDALDVNDRTALRWLWNAEYPAGIAHPDDTSLRRYLDSLGNAQHLLAYSAEQDIVGWLATFDREGERWFAMIVSRACQRQGIGSRLLRRAQDEAAGPLSGWAVDSDRFRRADGSTYPSPLEFYRALGFTVLENERAESDVLSTVRIRWGV